MKPISTKLHGVLDYSLSAALMALPGLVDEDNREKTLLPAATGAAATIYSLFTDYELGVWRKIPMKTHLKLDAGAALFLITSPLLSKRYGGAFPAAIGLVELSVALLTRSRTEQAQVAEEPMTEPATRDEPEPVWVSGKAEVTPVV